MNEQPKPGDSIQATISGGVSGQVAVGKNIAQTQVSTPRPEVTEADRAALRQLLADLRAQVAANAPPEAKDAALERVDELGEAITAKEPDLTTMEYVTRWFGKHLPQMAGIVTGVVIHPIVGKIVEAAGDLFATEFKQRFGRQ